VQAWSGATFLSSLTCSHVRSWGTNGPSRRPLTVANDPSGTWAGQDFRSAKALLALRHRRAIPARVPKLRCQHSLTVRGKRCGKCGTAAVAKDAVRRLRQQSQRKSSSRACYWSPKFCLFVPRPCARHRPAVAVFEVAPLAVLFLGHPCARSGAAIRRPSARLLRRSMRRRYLRPEKEAKSPLGSNNGTGSDPSSRWRSCHW
jgi:hypothetical protein